MRPPAPCVGKGVGGGGEGAKDHPAAAFRHGAPSPPPRPSAALRCRRCAVGSGGRAAGLRGHKALAPVVLAAVQLPGRPVGRWVHGDISRGRSPIRLGGARACCWLNRGASRHLPARVARAQPGTLGLLPGLPVCRRVCLLCVLCVLCATTTTTTTTSSMYRTHTYVAGGVAGARLHLPGGARHGARWVRGRGERVTGTAPLPLAPAQSSCKCVRRGVRSAGSRRRGTEERGAGMGAVGAPSPLPSPPRPQPSQPPPATATASTSATATCCAIVRESHPPRIVPACLSSPPRLPHGPPRAAPAPLP